MDHSKSGELFERARRVIPGGVNSIVRANAEPHPLFFARGKGSRVWDVDGNEYIDFVLGQGPLLLGHTPHAVVQAVRHQAALGLAYAGQTEWEVRAAESIVRLVPCAEMVRFNATGSEAVHSALRLARAFTGRKKVLRFEGHYHGWHDGIAWCPARRDADLGPPESPTMRPSSLGQPPEDAANLVVAPWNDFTRTQRAFEREGSELAAVICDPFACAAGLIPAEAGFLDHLRSLCDAHGTVLIFDEVITGFRVHIGGAQAHYGVTPDLAVFAKALGGGVAAAAVAGRADIMQLFGDGSVVHAGTSNANPLAMAAVAATLETLAANDAALLVQADARGRQMWDGLVSIAAELGLNMDVRGVPTCFSTTFLPDGAAPVTDFRSALRCDAAMLERFWRDIHHRGVHITAFGIWFLSTAHTERDIDETLEAALQCLRAMAETR